MKYLLNKLEDSHHDSVHFKCLKGNSGSDTTTYDDEKQHNSIENDEVR